MLSDVDEKILQYAFVISSFGKIRGEAMLKQDEVSFTSAERKVAMWIDDLKVYVITHYVPHAQA